MTETRITRKDTDLRGFKHPRSKIRVIRPFPRNPRCSYSHFKSASTSLFCNGEP